MLHNLKIELHPIKNGFIPNDVKIIIIGTFPPSKEIEEKKEDFFFYSSEKNHFWNRIDDISSVNLKKTKTKNSNESFFENANRKRHFSASKNIGFIDVFSKIKRKKETANDCDIIPVESIFDNKKFTEIIKLNSLVRICCTYKLAYEFIKEKLIELYSKDLLIQENELTANKELIILTVFNKKIEIILLYPATRSSHKKELKDNQYKHFILSK